MNFLYDQYSRHLRWLDKAYFAKANTVITIPPISDRDMEENRITIWLDDEPVRVSADELMLAEERPQDIEEEDDALLGCPVCGADPSHVLVEPVWIANVIGWQGVCTCDVCGTESIGDTSLYEDKAASNAVRTWNAGFVHVRRDR